MVCERFSVGSASAGPGEKGIGVINVGEFQDGSPINTPIIILNGVKPGPRLWITAGEHGNEYSTGAALIFNFLQKLNLEKLSGTVVVIPATNVTASQYEERYSPIDWKNMSVGTWPGDPDGRFIEQVAHIIWQEITKNADYLINIHDSQIGKDVICNFVTFAYDEGTDWGEASKKFAEAFGFKYIHHHAISSSERPSVEEEMDLRLLPHPLSNLCYVLHRRGIPAFTAEVGGHLEEYIDEAVQGIFNALIYLKMIDGTPKLPEKVLNVYSGALIRPRHGGLWKTYVKLEERVSKGQLLATVSNFYGETVEKIVSPCDGIITAMHIKPVIGTGEHPAFEIGSLDVEYSPKIGKWK